jgi:membrane protein
MEKKSGLIEWLKQAGRKSGENKAFKNSVVIAYYTIFSLPGLLVIIINIAAFAFGEQAVKDQLASQISTVVGADTAASVQEMIANTSKQGGTVLANIIGAVMLLIGATGVFLQLREILNDIWNVTPTRGSILRMFLDRAYSVGMILIIGFLLLVSLVLSAGIASMSKWMGSQFESEFIYLFALVDIVVSVGMISLLFAFIFKVMPDVKIPWRGVWPGAVLTAILFVVAKFALAIYFSKTDPGSTYGAAGSIVLIMLWVTYSSFILLYGANFVRVYCEAKNIQVEAKKGAVLNREKPSSQKASSSTVRTITHTTTVTVRR